MSIHPHPKGWGILDKIDKQYLCIVKNLYRNINSIFALLKTYIEIW